MKKAFTLIELLVVIAIIAILAAILMPALAKARGASRSAVCKAHEHDVGVALTLYRNDNGFWPYQCATNEKGLGALMPAYAGDAGIFGCPGGHSTTQAPEYNDTTKELLYPDFSLDLAVTSTSATRGLYGDRLNDGRNHQDLGGMNMLFGDTHVDWLVELPLGSGWYPNLAAFSPCDTDVYTINTGCSTDTSLEG
jgi:prepilin-type N-terminal cleavage/methylation domain-containing protein/prepilin-type processing-associated H-X9-DG protein